MGVSVVLMRRLARACLVVWISDSLQQSQQLL
jgi:hypothetical protein